MLLCTVSFQSQCSIIRLRFRHKCIADMNIIVFGFQNIFCHAFRIFLGVPIHSVSSSRSKILFSLLSLCSNFIQWLLHRFYPSLLSTSSLLVFSVGSQLKRKTLIAMLQIDKSSMKSISACKLALFPFVVLQNMHLANQRSTGTIYPWTIWKALTSLQYAYYAHLSSWTRGSVMAPLTTCRPPMNSFIIS